MKWQVLGDLRIRLRDGRNIEVSLYRTFADHGAYKMDGTYYRGSSDAEIVRTLTECAKRGKPVAGE